MYKEHEAFNPPPSDATLWRYMDFTKFVSLLDKQALFFTRADKLEDSFEGYLPNLCRAGMREFIEELSDPDRHKILQESIAFTKALPRFTLMSCWHENHHESAAMWKLYSKDDNGIAIKTDFDSFAKSFTASQVIHIGRISYVDYETHFFADKWWILPFLCKRRSFEHEREIRAIVQIIPTKVGKAEKYKPVDLSQDICDVGNYYEVDLSLLIQEVVIGPYAPDWLLELVQSVAARYNLEAPVVRSTLADNPTWD